MRTLIFLALFPISLFAQVPTNVIIYEEEEEEYAPCEPSIAVHPNDPSIVVGAAGLDYIFTSSEAGQTWNVDRNESPHGVYGDPCIVTDAKGNFYHLHLSNPSGEGWENPDILDRIVCQRSEDNGKSWTEGGSIGLNHPKDQDKEWAVYSAENGHLVASWTQFDEYGNSTPECFSNILFSWSSNGDEWSEPVQINEHSGNCIDNSGTTEGAVPAAGPDSEIYISWAVNGKIYFDLLAWDGEKYDQLQYDVEVVSDNANWDFEIPGLGRANGMPITDCDLSGKEHQGRIYINWADQRNGDDDTDIWLAYSDDKGGSWTDPIRVNDDNPGRHQFFTWMDIDQSTGYIYIVFYDRRHYKDNRTDVYLAVSKDGGDSFENRVISETPFSPPKKKFFGDYNNISAVNGVVRPIWTHHEKDKLSVRTALINE
mgnify:CR=1 FL=1